MKPKVSVIMPVLNGQKYIRTALESIAAQTYRPIEMIVVDDGSTDRTPAEIDRFSGRLDLKCVRHPERMGIARSVNDGLAHASGALIAFLDHDDAWFPDFLQTQVGYLENHPDVAMVHSDFQTIDADGRVLMESVAAHRKRPRPSGHVFAELFMDSFIVGNSVVIRKECLQRFGGFDESFRAADYHLWLRVARHYRVDYVGKVLTQYRQHATQDTRAAFAGHPGEESQGIRAIRMILEAYPEVWKEVGAGAIRRRLARLHFDLASSWFRAGVLSPARAWCAKAIRYWPLNGWYYVFYLRTLTRDGWRVPERRELRKASSAAKE